MENNLPRPVGSAEIKYSGIIFDIIHQKMQIGDKTKIFEQARRSPGVRVMLVDGNKMLVTKEYRTEIKGWDFRLPGGKVFDSLEEYRAAVGSGKDMLASALDAAKKEVLEETGLVVDEIRHFATSGTGGPTVRWDMYYFVADKFHLSDGGQMLEEGENITFEWVSLDDVRRLCLDGSFKEDRTVANILKFLMKNC
ncbi:MAG: NUDIX hydrolase [Candidatus Aenigmarchaeota archaeon]|nr:NUDIX hydrolase [Candidatus Aenigmarchaeota archaeon]